MNAPHGDPAPELPERTDDVFDLRPAIWLGVRLGAVAITATVLLMVLPMYSSARRTALPSEARMPTPAARLAIEGDVVTVRFDAAPSADQRDIAVATLRAKLLERGASAADLRAVIESIEAAPYPAAGGPRGAYRFRLPEHLIR